MFKKKNIKYMLNEFSRTYPWTTILNKFFDIFKMHNIKMLYYAFQTIYNFFNNKDKALASLIFLGIESFN